MFFSSLHLFTDPKDSYSSYDSLDKYNYALETLKLSDSGNYFNGNNCMLQPKCRQPYIHNSEIVKTDEKITPKLPPRPPLPRSSLSSSTIDKDLAKQQQLSDWYYIKPGPKSPLPTQRNIKMQGIYSSTKPITANIHNSNNDNNNNNNNQRNDGTYVKSSTTRTNNTNGMMHETAKTNLNIRNENITKRVGNTANLPFAGDKCDVQIIDAKNGQHDEQRLKQHVVDDSDDNGIYQAIGVPTTCDNIYMPSNLNYHQYSGNEPLCKSDERNGDKVNGISDRQRLLLLSPPSPSMSAQQKLHKEHPYYYVESLQQKHAQKPLPSPRQDRKLCTSYARLPPNNGFTAKSPNDMNRPQCEQNQISSKLQPIYNEPQILLFNCNASTNGGGSDLNFYHVPKLQSQHHQKQQQLQHHRPMSNDDSNGLKHANVTTSGFSSLSASSDVTVDEQRSSVSSKNKFTDDERNVRATNNGIEDNRQYLPQTVSASPLLPHSNQHKVSTKFFT